ncbi:MAG: helix-turn-helix transcriptional regulator [Gordonibacter pamelaeae]|uniref:Helix-turn-helix domain-containing protein n=1 Tax=Gordonibacter urolithinfaciens TaxID=1335613 RepID=A0A7K0IAR1_9ACTN|nr:MULTISPECIES: helix-turn-helix transcriptional regulator [Gordonibacter]MBS6975343.1 helix-turn-helix transcriptional regulator [Eggerthellaceae bacterium]MBS4895434.1 helix-turn-helix transcriptional regulator [Gordonibacter pamelaeae]MCB6311785.1 helix-turn-helix transcriptional regulator [Gordonibacter pamelaeae]MCB6562750.1 helix-turn-helix transcriptional regulator [Gordonibacter urolithinfaciens]MCQ4848036.1 helix-turn-helix transcriptional regulator [Gordonibacter pamelaeae]
MPYDKERVARRLKSLRVDAGMEQADLAEASGVGLGTIASAETCRTGMNLDTAFDLTEALGCTLEQLVCRDEGRVA